jgi:uncharacterized membrane protein
MLSSVSSRLSYIDWMRGLACVLMFQTHCYDSWLGGGARQSRFFMWSQVFGTFPAPLFLFLAGMSFALVTGKLLEKRRRFAGWFWRCSRNLGTANPRATSSPRNSSWGR